MLTHILGQMKRYKIAAIALALIMTSLTFYCFRQSAIAGSPLIMWYEFSKTVIRLDKETGEYNAIIPEEIKYLAGKEISIRGFMIPIESLEKSHHFLIAMRSPTCPFCPPGKPNEVVDVHVDNPISWSEERVTVNGILELMNDTKLGLFFKLTHGTAE